MKTDVKDRPGSYVQKLGRQAGVAMHITSLPGEHGVGDIGDSAMKFIDQLEEMNLGVWQILPTGPTAYGDSPYQPLSAFAGNPMFIGMNPLIQMGLLKSNDVAPLQSLPQDHTDYGHLIPAKEALLGQAAEKFISRTGHGPATDYDDFQHQHGERWLDDYALFRLLKSLHNQRAWPEWEKQYVRREPAALDRIRNEHRLDIEKIKVTQFLFDHQWQQFKAYAAEKGICLFGDMPIYIALDSSDAWAHPQRLQINIDGQPSHVAGVPPDYFSNDGQLWGNPLYDWDYHESTGYRWWIERIAHASSQTPMVRIDHFRGFEAYWSVPHGEATARNGEWITGPGDSLFLALREAMGTLPIVAEDLGVITPAVDQLRENHGLPGMVVLQFEVGNEAFDIASVQANSVCYTGTHDNDTTLGWFLGSGDDTRSEEEVRREQAGALKHTAGSSGTIAHDMIRLAFSSNSTLAVAPMQDYLGLGSDARLNVPGTTLNNWRWRMLPEQLQAPVKESIQKLVVEGQRLCVDQ